MPKLTLLTYSDDKYSAYQKNISAQARMYGFNTVSRTREQLQALNFFQDNKKIFNQPRGSGYWLWKPFLILDTIGSMNEGDILLYMDCGDRMDNNPYTFLQTVMKDRDILLTLGGHPQKNYTKYDCFYLMKCNEEKYYNQIQMEAGMVVCKKTAFTLKVISEWLSYCMDERILTDMPNQFGENLTGFIDHRHDQSVLTNLKVKYDLMATDEMRSYITCNINEPQKV